MIELNSGVYGVMANEAVLEALADADMETLVVVHHYGVPSSLRKRLHILTQVRHEIIHPALGPAVNEPTPRRTSRR